MQHQCEHRAISQVIADRCEELFDFFLMSISGKVVTLINVMSVGDDWISDPLITNICHVVKEHAQGDQPPPDCSLCASEIRLPSNELIHIVHCDGLRSLTLCPFEKDAYIAGIM
jgi:hypothetical protein